MRGTRQINNADCTQEHEERQTNELLLTGEGAMNDESNPALPKKASTSTIPSWSELTTTPVLLKRQQQELNNQSKAKQPI